MADYYPGSKTKVKSYGPDYKPPEPEIDDMNLGTPKVFSVNGKSTELYPVGSLASMLNRKPGTIRKWENEGIIPAATYMLPGNNNDHRGNRRLYTLEQITGLRKIAQEEGILHPTARGKWAAVEATQFKKKALDLFKELESAT